MPGIKPRKKERNNCQRNLKLSLFSTKIGIIKNLIPKFNNLKQIALENGSIGFGISGSGPSMFSLSKGPENANKVKRKLEDYLNKKNLDFKSYVSAVNDEGIKII